MHNGAVFVSVVVDRSGRTLVSPQVSGRGILDGEDEQETRERRLQRTWPRRWTPCRGRRRVRRARSSKLARQAIRRALRESRGKRPVIDVQIARVPG